MQSDGREFAVYLKKKKVAVEEAATKIGVSRSYLSTQLNKEGEWNVELKAKASAAFDLPPDFWAQSDAILKSLPTDIVKGIEAGDTAARLAKRETASERDRRLEIENAKLEAENKLLREMVDKLMGQLEKK